MKIGILAGLSAVTMTVSAVPAVAQVAVYTNQALFDSQRPGIATNTFPFTGSGYKSVAPTYTLDNVSFSATNLVGFGANSNSLTPAHLDSESGALTISFGGPVLGLTLAAFDGAQTVSYVINGVTGSLALPADQASAFIGFDTGSSTTSINAVFNFTVGSDLDVLGFQTAVPEAATWAMMMVGLGLVGGSLRRRRSVSTRVSFA